VLRIIGQRGQRHDISIMADIGADVSKIGIAITGAWR